MTLFYVLWTIGWITLVLSIDRLVYGNWYWQFEGNLWKLWRANR